MADGLRATWGVKSSVGGNYGIVVGIDLRGEGSFITETYLDGSVSGVFLYDVSKTLSCDILIKQGVTGPSIGSTITIATNEGYVKDVQITESNQSYQKLHITAEAHKNASSAYVQ